MCENINIICSTLVLRKASKRPKCRQGSNFACKVHLIILKTLDAEELW